MKRALIVFAALSFTVSSGIAADDDPMHELLTRQSSNPCEDYAYNAMQLIPQLYYENNLDSCVRVITYWEEECETNYEIERLKILFSIVLHEFIEDLYGDDIIDNLIDYREYWPDLDLKGSSDNANATQYDYFFWSLAEAARSELSPDDVGHLLSSFYLGGYNQFFRRLRSSTFRETRLQQYYFKRLRDLHSNRGTQRHYCGMLGWWHPLGPIDVFGGHPQLGGATGWRMDKWQFDFSLQLRFLGADQPWVVQYWDGHITTTDFGSACLGADGAYEAASVGLFSLNLMAGIGFESILTDDLPADGTDKIKDIYSYNINAGPGLRLYFSERRTWYTQVWGKYNILDFNNRGGTSLAGDAVTFGITVGRFVPGPIDKTLRLLGDLK